MWKVFIKLIQYFAKLKNNEYRYIMAYSCIKTYRIYGVVACTLADSPSGIVPISGDNLIRTKYVAATTYQPPRAVKIEGIYFIYTLSN